MNVVQKLYAAYCANHASSRRGPGESDERPDPSDDQIRHYISGNLCRCGAYPEIIAAVKLAARKRRG